MSDIFLCPLGVNMALCRCKQLNTFTQVLYLSTIVKSCALEYFKFMLLLCHSKFVENILHCIYLTSVTRYFSDADS